LSEALGATSSIHMSTTNTKAQKPTQKYLDVIVRVDQHKLHWFVDAVEVIERRDDGRLTIRYNNGRLLMGQEPESFERVPDIGLRAKGK